ncbi:hypothetical protein [Fodinicola feengrottensis]
MSSPVVLGGIVNVDEMDCSARGFAGLTFRVFDLATSQWSIYWVNNHRGQLEPPVVGGFSDGVGLFHGDDTYQDRSIQVRFTWSEITATSAHWEQAFSADHGETWETNWTVELTRTS